MAEETVLVEDSFDFRRYLILLRHWAWLLILSSVVIGVATYYYNKLTSRNLYRASTTLLVNEASSATQDGYSAMVRSGRLVNTYAQLMVTRPILSKVVERLGLSIEPEGLRSAVAVNVDPSAQLIRIVVTSKDTFVVDVANTLVAVFAEHNESMQGSRYAASKGALKLQLDKLNQQIQDIEAKLGSTENRPADPAEQRRLETTLAEFRQTYASLLQTYEQVRMTEAQNTSTILQVDPAVTMQVIKPGLWRNTFLMAFLAFALIFIGIHLKESLDDTFKNPDEITQNFGLPILGTIAHFDSPDVNIVIKNSKSPISEAFRSIRTQIHFLGTERPIRTIIVTSPSMGEGKSTVALNLAAVMGQTGRSISLVDADLRRPTLHKKLDLSENGRGLSSLFTESQVVLNGALKETVAPNCFFLNSGDLPPNPAELLGSQRMIEIIDRLKERSDVVIIDTPPIMAVTDAPVLSPHVDGVLIVVKPGVTKRAGLKQSVEQLRRLGGNILGVVINDVDFQAKGSYYYYYHYHNYYYQEYYGSEQSGKARSQKKRRDAVTN